MDNIQAHNGIPRFRYDAKGTLFGGQEIDMAFGKNFSLNKFIIRFCRAR